MNRCISNLILATRRITFDSKYKKPYKPFILTARESLVPIINSPLNKKLYSWHLRKSAQACRCLEALGGGSHPPSIFWWIWSFLTRNNNFRNGLVFAHSTSGSFVHIINSSLKKKASAGFQRDTRSGKYSVSSMIRWYTNIYHENQIAPGEKAKDWEHLGTFGQLGMAKT